MAGGTGRPHRQNGRRRINALALHANTTDGTGAKAPRTERGRRTVNRLLAAAGAEFAERGYHDASITSITRRAGVALGSFYTWFDSKDAIFRALVGHMSSEVGRRAAAAVAPDMDALTREGAALRGFLEFAREHREIYRIIDEAEFVDPASWRAHYEGAADRIAGRLADGMAAGVLRDGLGEVEAWAVMGMNVFLGLRYAVWDEQAEPAEVAARANRLLGHGIARRTPD